MLRKQTTLTSLSRVAFYLNALESNGALCQKAASTRQNYSTAQRVTAILVIKTGPYCPEQKSQYTNQWRIIDLLVTEITLGPKTHI